MANLHINEAIMSSVTMQDGGILFLPKFVKIVQPTLYFPFPQAIRFREGELEHGPVYLRARAKQWLSPSTGSSRHRRPLTRGGLDPIAGEAH